MDNPHSDPSKLSLEQDFMYPSSEEDVRQLAENCLSTADLSASCKPDVSRINTLQFIAQLRLSIRHVATVLGRQTLPGEFWCLGSTEAAPTPKQLYSKIQKF